MKKIGKVVLAFFSFLVYSNSLFWTADYYTHGYLYPSLAVQKSICLFRVIVLLVLLILVVLNVMMFKGKKGMRILSVILLIVSIPLCIFGALFGTFSSMFDTFGCSYTEDIANYGEYDIYIAEHDVSFFPDSITEDMTVVDYAYFYKYRDVGHADVYLEIHFENQGIMEEYLEEAKNAISEKGYLSYQNPYDPQYTNIVPNELRLSSGQDGRLISRIKFAGDEDYKYVDMVHELVSYSYDDLIMIYNFTRIGSDIEVGQNPDDGEYYPKYLERFNVEWDADNDFKYAYVKE